jgi:hypothetical protein
MKTNNTFPTTNTLVTIVLVVLAVLLVFGVLTGKKIPFISSERAALLVLFIIGFAMCPMGIGRVAATGQWVHPLSIISYILGVLIIASAAGGYFGFHFLYVIDARSGIIAVTLLVAVKLIISITHSLIK